MPAEAGAPLEAPGRPTHLGEARKLVEVVNAIGTPANEAGDYTVAGLRLGW